MLSRLKDIRTQHLKLKQSEFADAIGLTQPNYSMIESGKRTLSNKHIKIICKEFNINEVWLRTGNGPKFYNSAEENELIALFTRLLPPNRKLAIEIVRSIHDSQNELESFIKSTLSPNC